MSQKSRTLYSTAQENLWKVLEFQQKPEPEKKDYLLNQVFWWQVIYINYSVKYEK